MLSETKVNFQGKDLKAKAINKREKEDDNLLPSFSNCSDLRRYLAFLPDEKRSIQELTDWLLKEQFIFLDQAKENSFYQAKPVKSLNAQPETSCCLAETFWHLEERKELLNQIVYHIARLHASYRATLVSLYFEQRNMRDTAALLGKSLSTVKRYRDAAILDLFFRLKQQELARYPIN